jgi:hypothetical protein
LRRLPRLLRAQQNPPAEAGGESTSGRLVVLLLAALSLSALTTLLAAALSGLLLLLAWLLLAAAALLLARLVLTTLLLAGILLVRIVHKLLLLRFLPCDDNHPNASWLLALWAKFAAIEVLSGFRLRDVPWLRSKKDQYGTKDGAKRLNQRMKQQDVQKAQRDEAEKKNRSPTLSSARDRPARQGHQ